MKELSTSTFGTIEACGRRAVYQVLVKLKMKAKKVQILECFNAIGF
ncbi:hypothetical protein ACFFGS_08770 [Lactiplantibacillus plajomi]|uniref:Mobile element protein n=1 Tax=Lactiplantibacillus plajomi TaxID=1457217 RepID=A0ABV6K424_9LACO